MMEHLALYDVSIHASAREATNYAFRFDLSLLRFNPRLRTGGDDDNYLCLLSYGSFNPRLRTGGDEHFTEPWQLMASFNPRLRTGGDILNLIRCLGR